MVYNGRRGEETRLSTDFEIKIEDPLGMLSSLLALHYASLVKPL